MDNRTDTPQDQASGQEPTMLQEPADQTLVTPETKVVKLAELVEGMTLDQLAELAEEAANNPQTSAPLRVLIPALVAVVRAHAEVLVLLGA